MPTPQIEKHEIYPDANHGSADFSIVMPTAQNQDAEVTLSVDAMCINDDATVGLGGKLSFTASVDNLRDLAAFLTSVIRKLEKLPEED